MLGLARKLAEEIELELLRMLWRHPQGAAPFHNIEELARRFGASSNTLREATHRLRAVGLLETVNMRLWTVPWELAPVDSLHARLRAAQLGEERVEALEEWLDLRRTAATVALSRCARPGVVRDLVDARLSDLRVAAGWAARPSETVDAVWHLMLAAVDLSGGPGLRSLCNSLARSRPAVRPWELLAHDWEAAARLAEALERSLHRQSPASAVAAWAAYEDHMGPRLFGKARTVPDPRHAVGEPWLQPRMLPVR